MFKSLAATLPRAEAPPSGGSLAIVDAPGSDGAFLLHHFLGQGLSAPSGRVCLVACAQPLHHYAAVAARAGLDLGQHVAGKTLLHLDALSQREGSLALNWYTMQHCAPPLVAELGVSAEPMQRILQAVEEALRSAEGCWTVLLDDVGIYQDLGVSTAEVVALVQAIGALVDELNGSLIYLVHDEPDCTGASLAHLLMHRASVVVHVRGLASGHSQDVHGLVTVSERQVALPRRTALHYKRRERTVDFFPVGTSPAIL